MLTSFKYLGRVISVVDEHWLEVIWNLAKSQKAWRKTTRNINRDGARLWVSSFFLKSVVQLVLLFGAKMWVGNPHMRRVLGGFQDQVAQRLTGRLPQWRLDGKCEYTSEKATRVEAGLKTMETHIRKIQNMVVQYIAT